MARAPATTADRLSALITEIEAEAYARGRADARKELLDLLGTGTGRSCGRQGVAGETGEACRRAEAQGERPKEGAQGLGSPFRRAGVA